MRTSSAVKKDLSRAKLSTVRPSPQSPSTPAFDRQRLVSELLSLGNDRIRPEIAQQISEEVETELKRRSSPHLSPEIISEIVQFKLEELGLIEIRRRRSKITKPEDEPTVTLYPSSDREANPAPAEKAEVAEAPVETAAQLPTLDKFLRSANSTKPLPPKANVKIALRAMRRMREVFAVEDSEIGQRLESLYEEIAALAGAVEKKYPAGKDADTVSVEFFNAMANQEFYPQLPVLFQFLEGPSAPTRRWGPTALTWRLDAPAIPALLDKASSLWRENGDVVICLEAPAKGDSASTEVLERFFQGVEDSLMSLPDDRSIPAAVTLRLSAGLPGAEQIVEHALSGKYFPKFRFEWRLTEDPSELAALESVLHMTWKKSEPSLVYFDKAYGASAHSRLSHLEAGHPGGTPALSQYEGGSLGSLNLSIVGAGSDVDWAKLRRMIRTGVHFLDNLLDISANGNFPEDQPRRLGLGVMGFAELLLKLGIPYDSDGATVLAEKIFRFLRQEAQLAAAALAKRWDEGKEEAVDLSPLPRHEALLAIRTENCLADLAEVSPGLRPLAAVIEDGRPLPLLRMIAQQRKVWSDEIAEEIVEKHSVRDAETAPRPLRRLFLKADEISSDWPLKMLGAAQRHCDIPVTGSLQLPETLSFAELIAKLTEARGFGVTRVEIPEGRVFLETDRDPEEISTNLAPESEAPPIAAEASEASLVLSLEQLASAASEPAEEEGKEDLTEAEIASPLDVENLPLDTLASGSLAASLVGDSAIASCESPAKGLQPRARPEVLQATARLIQTGCGPMHVSFARDEHGPYEVRAQLGQSGSCASAQTETISRLLSLCLSTGVDQKLVYEQLRGVRCPKSAIDRGDKVLSCSDGIARVFERELGFAKKEISSDLSDDEEITAITDIDSLQ